MSNSRPRQLLELNLSDAWRRLQRRVIDQLCSGYEAWTLAGNRPEEISSELWDQAQLALYLQFQVGDWLDGIKRARVRYYEFQHDFQVANSEAEGLEHLLSIAESMGYSQDARIKIEQGSAEWFDENAVFDCYQQQQARREQNVAICLERLGDLIAHMLADRDVDTCATLWRTLALHETLLEPFQYSANPHIKKAAFSCLRRAVDALPQDVERPVPPATRHFVFRTCLDEKADLWLRSEALALGARLDSGQFRFLVTQLFIESLQTDIYLLGRAVRLLCQYHASLEDIDSLLQLAWSCRSEYVRQRLAEYATQLPYPVALRYLTKQVNDDSSGKVRAQAVLSLTEMALDAERGAAIVQLQVKTLATEQDQFVLRTLLYSLQKLFAESSREGISDRLFTQVMATLTALHTGHEQTAMRRWAAQTREAIWQAYHQAMLPALSRQQLADLMLHQKARLKVPEQLERETLLRYLANLGSQRYGYDIVLRRGVAKIAAGFKFGFRSWRMLHETRNPATDKRQNHNHLKGRIYYGAVQTGTRKMAECSVTKVPGEPLQVDGEQGWRDYLPLLDQVLSALDQGWRARPLEIYTSEGITEMMPPKSLWRRLRARALIQWRFARIADLRNWREGDQRPADSYLRALADLGFSFRIRGHLQGADSRYPVDDRVQRFFPAIALPFVIPSWEDAQNYFYSVYQNSIQQLLIFTTLVSGGVLLRHSWVLAQLRLARRKIPLVVGGWGTRGKSGTERLKAALFNSLGFSVMSKSTGCEAMFLHGAAGRPMKEMFLFRPYDKATIWEQVFLTRLAGKMGADIFLWECMGLTPRYIDILQNQWMRDDIATITNCYPDHEDLQGPAGIEIPLVMQRFVPKASVLVTSEDTMLPLLEDAAARKGTEMHSVDWLAAGLLSDEVVSRFPYEEHPNNIALVATMAEQLGVEKDYALKEMADNVIADLGVLKIYPVTSVRQRRFEFINGMSANERLAALGNWRRTGMADHNLEDEPGTWLSIVVNNRADRVARSKVFAAMLVSDMQADRYYFIGNNLGGFAAYIEEAWQSYIEKQNFAEAADREGALLCKEAARYRIPTSEEQVLERLRSCVDGLNVDLDVKVALLEKLPETLTEQSLQSWKTDGLDEADGQLIEQQFRKDGAEYLQLKAFLSALQAGATDRATLHDKIASWLWECFRSRWVVVENYYSTGNQTINTIVSNTPPGLFCRMIGVQNIKGTGLDFIYRWQAWDKVWNFCEVLEKESDEHQLQAAAKALATWEEYGLLDGDKVAESLDIARTRRETQRELLQAEIQVVGERVQKQLQAVTDSLSQGQEQSSRLAGVISFLEALLDSGDAVKRRKRADAIYRALLNNLISYDRAAVELAALTKAQKGGWLSKRLSKYL